MQEIFGSVENKNWLHLIQNNYSVLIFEIVFQQNTLTIRRSSCLVVPAAKLSRTRKKTNPNKLASKSEFTTSPVYPRTALCYHGFTMFHRAPRSTRIIHHKLHNSKEKKETLVYTLLFETSAGKKGWVSEMGRLCDEPVRTSWRILRDIIFRPASSSWGAHFALDSTHEIDY